MNWIKNIILCILIIIPPVWSYDVLSSFHKKEKECYPIEKSSIITLSEGRYSYNYASYKKPDGWYRGQVSIDEVLDGCKYPPNPFKVNLAYLIFCVYIIGASILLLFYLFEVLSWVIYRW